MCVSFIPSIHPSIHLSVCLPACLPVSVRRYPYIHRFCFPICVCAKVLFALMFIQLLCLSAPVFFCRSVHLSIYLSICMSVCQSACLAQSHQDILKLHQSLHPNTLSGLSGLLSSVSITDSLSILSVSSPLCLHLHNLQVLAHCFTAEFRL